MHMVNGASGGTRTPARRGSGGRRSIQLSYGRAIQKEICSPRTRAFTASISHYSMKNGQLTNQIASMCESSHSGQDFLPLWGFLFLKAFYFWVIPFFNSFFTSSAKGL